MTNLELAQEIYFALEEKQFDLEPAGFVATIESVLNKDLQRIAAENAKLRAALQLTQDERGQLRDALMATKYYLEFRNESRWRVALRVYRDDPRIYGGAASMEAAKLRDFKSSELEPAQVRINLALRDGYTVEETERLIEWMNVAKEVAARFDLLIKDVADFERVMLEPWYENVVGVFEEQGQIIIHFPDSWETL